MGSEITTVLFPLTKYPAPLSNQPFALRDFRHSLPAKNLVWPRFLCLAKFKARLEGHFEDFNAPRNWPVILGVDSYSICFKRRSFQTLAVFSRFLEVFWKDGSLERMGMEVSPRVMRLPSFASSTASPGVFLRLAQPQPFGLAANGPRAPDKPIPWGDGV